jgi:hypothetical protein
MSTPFLDKLRELLGGKKTPDTPAPAPEPVPAKKPGAIDYLKAWNLLKNIQIQQLGRVVGASSVIVFFAISGCLAWFSLFLRFVLSLIH